MITKANAATTHFKGDEAEYTGAIQTVAGGTFYEIVLLEGHMKGQTKLVTNAPPTVAAVDMTALPVRRCQIECIEHPEWGTWGVYEDRGDYYEIHGRRGGRVLDKS